MSVRSEVPASFRSSAIRPGLPGLILQGLQEIGSRRRLIRHLVVADVRKRGADSLLGNVWWVIDPLLQMLVYVVLVSLIFNRAQEAYPLFIFCAILPWKWFNSVVMDGLSSVVGMERLIKQINFPKLVLPVAAVMAGIVNFAFGLIPLAALMLVFYPSYLSPWLFAIPLIAFVQLLFSLPIAIGLSAVNVFYRDVGNLSRHLLRVWFYLSPALYGPELIANVTEKSHLLGRLMALNPFATLFTAYRDVIYYKQAPDWSALAGLSLVSILLLAVAVYVFKRLEPTFAKVL